MHPLLSSWQVWALLSAAFAALTAIFAKQGVSTVAPDVATFIRTVLILAMLGIVLIVGGAWRGLAAVFSGGLGGRGLWYLTLSALATGASWLCYFRALNLGDASRVAPIDKLSVVLVAVFGALFLGERLSATGWLGVALIALGAALVAYRA